MTNPTSQLSDAADGASLDVPAIRLVVLKRMCAIWALLGGIILAVVGIDDVLHGRYATAAFYTAAYVLVIFCLLPGLLPYALRSTVPVAALYAVGSFEIYLHGLNSAGNLFYYALILFSCILMGVRVAAVMTVVATLSMCLISYSFAARMNRMDTYSSVWSFFHLECLPDVVSLCLLSTMAITFLSLMLQNLERSVRTSREYLVEIGRERNQLIRIIEERDQVERQLRQAQRLEAVGQLAGGIAHDFNNLLQVVCAHTDILLRKSAPGSSDHEQLNEVRKASERAAALTRQLLAYSRQQVMTLEYLDLNALVREFTSMLHRLLPANIEIQFTPGDPLGTVHADPRQLDQVLMNLCLNARDAMASGGILRIETGNVTLDQEFVAHNPWAEAGSFVRVTVRDTGTGIDAAEQDRIFEPFYTTKKLGEGTGLGLSMAYGIVKQHQGLIHASNDPGAGARFQVYLPLVDHLAQPASVPSVLPVRRGAGTILVAEDDDSVRELIISVLEGAGYTVLPAEHGEKALALFSEHKNSVDLLLFDIMMPRMGGKEACRAIRAIEPAIRVLFMSGYAPEGLGGDLELGRRTAFIQKPYRTQELLERVRETLEA